VKIIISKFKSKIKKIYLTLTRRYAFLKKEIKCKSVWLGSWYGGFYINPKLVNEKSTVYSFGIGEDISFDIALINRYNCKVFGFDPTPKSINWVRNQKLSDNFYFFEYGIGKESGLVDFFLPKNSSHISGSLVSQTNINLDSKIIIEVKTLADTMKELEHKHIDILKMDIEGAEYDVIDHILNTKVSITQLLVEFHDRFEKNGIEKTIDTVKKLKLNGFKIFAISDSFEEVSFVNERYL